MQQMLYMTRLPISLMVAASTLFGYLLYEQTLNRSAAVITAAAFFLTIACSILNQIQEIDIDRLMHRTKQRPLPSGTMSMKTAVFLSLFAFTISAILFLSLQNSTLLLLGIIIVAVYNGLYTPLKTRTSFSLLIGATVGAFPPLLGWTAAGGRIDSPVILAITSVYYFWQIPHFWLLAEKYQEDYTKAGIKIPTLMMPIKLKNMLTGIWLLGYALSMLLVSLTLHEQTSTFIIQLFVFGFILSIPLLIRYNKMAFITINISVLVFSGLLLLKT